MKYITEEELRDLFNVQAFETFTLTGGARLTPGGRQFLVDRKIPIIVQGEEKAKNTVSIPANEKNNCSAHNIVNDQRVNAHFALLEAIFFKQVMDLLERNENLANQIYDMKCSLESIAGGNENGIVPEAWGELSKEPLQYPPKECFPMRRDIMFAEHGKEAAALHLLQCELQKFYFDNEDRLTAAQKKHLAYLMNRLSQMIQSILGREHC